jgi:hypothetical protein
MDSLIPFTTSGALVDCVDSTSTSKASYHPNDHLSFQLAPRPFIAFAPSFFCSSLNAPGLEPLETSQ